MTSGRDALHTIDHAIADLRRKVSELISAAGTDSSTIAKLEAEELEIYQSFAQIRVAHVAATESTRHADPVDQKVRVLIEKHQSLVEDLRSDAQKLEAELASLEQARKESEARHDRAVDEHDTSAARTRKRLEDEERYQGLADALENANAVVRRAALKLQSVQQTEKEKGAPYRADPLFRYLFDRSYGTRAYSAPPPFSWLDGWVARLIHYKDNRLNYERLRELPKFLEAHLNGLEEAADAAEDALENYERAELERDGVADLKKIVEDTAQNLEAADAAIETHEAKLAEVNVRYERAAAGDSDFLKEAHSLVASEVAKLGLRDLARLAAETTSLQDESLVEALDDIADRKETLREAHREVSRSVKRERGTLSTLESIRKKFKRSHFDSPYSDFSGRQVVASLLSEFLTGALSGDQLWDQLERRHRTRRRDWDIGMGGRQWKDGFGLPKDWGRGGGVDWGDILVDSASKMPRRRRQKVRVPRAPRPARTNRPRRSSSGRGGFKTGGGF